MSKRLRSEVELCFDSMTDLITNLAGGLTLVVLLLIGLTREAPKAAEPRPAPEAAKARESIRDLVRRLNELEEEVGHVNADVMGYETELKEWEKRVEKLHRDAKPAPIPPAAK